MKVKVWKVCILCLDPATGSVAGGSNYVNASNPWAALNIVVNCLPPVMRAQADQITVTCVGEKDAPLIVVPDDKLGTDAERGGE